MDGMKKIIVENIYFGYEDLFDIHYDKYKSFKKFVDKFDNLNIEYEIKKEYVLSILDIFLDACTKEYYTDEKRLYQDTLDDYMKLLTLISTFVFDSTFMVNENEKRENTIELHNLFLENRLEVLRLFLISSYIKMFFLSVNEMYKNEDELQKGIRMLNIKKFMKKTLSNYKINYTYLQNNLDDSYDLDKNKIVENYKVEDIKNFLWENIKIMYENTNKNIQNDDYMIYATQHIKNKDIIN